MNDAGSGASDKIDSDDDDGKKVNVKKLPTTLLSPLNSTATKKSSV